MIEAIETIKEFFSLVGVAGATIATGVAIWYSAAWCAGAIGRIFNPPKKERPPFLHESDEHPAVTKWPGFRNPPLTFRYTNYRGEVGVRHVQSPHFYWGATDWHPEPGWLMRAWDLDKQAWRDFAVADMVFLKPEEGHNGAREES